MQTDQILDRKGRDVATITPESPVRAAVEQLGTANVGALVVSADGTTVVGIVSERDVVRRLAADGPALLDEPVSSIMQADVLTCTGTDPVDDLMHRMTEHRIRHLPVVDDGPAGRDHQHRRRGEDPRRRARDRARAARRLHPHRPLSPRSARRSRRGGCRRAP